MKRGKIERQILLIYGNVYEEYFDLMTNLRKLPQQTSLEFIAYLLHLFNVRKRSDKDFHNRHLITWMMHMTGSCQQHLRNFVNVNRSQVFDPRFKLLERRPCLDLIQHLLKYADPENKTELGKAEFGTLFKLLLTFNSQAIDHEKHIFDWDGTESFQYFADEVLRVQIRDIENERFKDYVIQFLKVYYFFEFCENSTQFGSYLKMFLGGLSLQSYRSYLWMLLSPYLNMMVHDEPSPKMYMEGNEQFLSFYYRMAVNDNIQIDKDYKSLRSYPLYVPADNTFIFLDFRFFVDKFYTGFLFDFASRTGISFANLKKSMGSDFSEKLLFYTAMRNCFEGYGDINLSGEQLKVKLKESEPDYYIRKDSKIFVFEFKDIIIPSEVKYADGVEKIKEGLLDKLERDSKGKRKGIAQLLNCIKEMSNGKYAKNGIDLVHSEETIIFPILVHTDITLEAYGTNYFLKQRMSQLMQEDGMQTKGVQDLTLIYLDNLLLLQDHFKNGKLDLGDCIISYSTYISSGDPVNDMISFDEFIKYYFVEKYKVKIGQPSIFKEIITRFEREAKTDVFS